MQIEPATIADAEQILALQHLAYQSEAALYQDWTIPPLRQTLDELRAEFAHVTALKAQDDARLVGSVRAEQKNGVVSVGRLMAHPDNQGRGIGTRLLLAIETFFPKADVFELFTGSLSERNLQLYERLGYRRFRTAELTPKVTTIFLRKPAAGRR